MTHEVYSRSFFRCSGTMIGITVLSVLICGCVSIYNENPGDDAEGRIRGIYHDVLNDSKTKANEYKKAVSIASNESPTISRSNNLFAQAVKQQAAIEAPYEEAFRDPFLQIALPDPGVRAEITHNISPQLFVVNSDDLWPSATRPVRSSLLAQW